MYDTPYLKTHPSDGGNLQKSRALAFWGFDLNQSMNYCQASFLLIVDFWKAQRDFNILAIPTFFSLMNIYALIFNPIFPLQK